MRKLTDEQRAAYARDALDNPILQEALQNLEDKAVRAWDGTGVADIDARERAWQQRRAVKELVKALESILRKDKHE